jgi:hypothetical protein
MYGQHLAGYYSYYDTMRQLGAAGIELLDGQMQVARSAGWWWCFRGFAVLTERPRLLRRDQDNRLHCDHGPAILYPDGWGFYAWHGRRVPEWVILAPTAEKIIAEPNVEIRRCAIESMGWSQFAEAAGLVPIPQGLGGGGARVPDPGNTGQTLILYDVPRDLWGGPVRLLLTVNGSCERDGTRRRYGLTVPAHISDPVEAAGWTVGLTAEQYARTVRRT